MCLQQTLSHRAESLSLLSELQCESRLGVHRPYDVTKYVRNIWRMLSVSLPIQLNGIQSENMAVNQEKCSLQPLLCYLHCKQNYFLKISEAHY